MREKVLVLMVLSSLWITLDSTVIIVEDAKACFRRVLAGKRVARALVRRGLFCERIEDCQQECAEEKHFACEGFNYRLDETGGGRGECELLDIPLSHLDIGRDVYPDPDYDYYERDRNAAQGSCKHHSSNYGNNRRLDHAYQHYYHPISPPVRRPPFENHHRYYGGTSYLPHEFDRRHSYLPPDKDWGRFDLKYNGYGHSQSYDLWGLKKNQHGGGSYPPDTPNGIGYPHKIPPSSPGNQDSSYLPPKPFAGYNPHRLPSTTAVGSYLPPGPFGAGYSPPRKPPPPGGSYLPSKIPHESYLPPSNDLDAALLPLEPRYNFLKDECSLRSATGFRLTKGIVKKYVYVPNIYECELLCFREKDFHCASYAYRYTIDLTTPTDNCYLSDKSYKLLDFYTDLQQDKDFDIYTMNNGGKCEQPMVQAKDNSDCFWRVRSGHRLDQQVVLDSLQVHSIVECQIECLNSRRFTCRAFSFRYGLAAVGGSIDNCQLTDWPYYELKPKHFIPEQGYELYDRGSFGHGCEPDHFGIRGKAFVAPEEDIDKVCYASYNSPVKLTPQAIRKEIRVNSEAECKTECTKLRETTLFQCMSFSITFNSWAGGAVCKLSDIYQRDLLPHVDYQPEPESWLFAWDNYNPHCKLQRNDRYLPTALDTWRVYTVSGLPCKRGTTCRENREAGFWFCHLEGEDTWDYCCRPDHQCGFSQHYPYQWCYVGPANTQWRKCSDRYYPYFADRFDNTPPLYGPKPAIYGPRPPIYDPGTETYGPRPPLYDPKPVHRPDRPPAPPTRPPPSPSLDQYEEEFETQFLEPPKPGGFGRPRHWPLQYLHKQQPPNHTEAESSSNPKYAAIQSLIDVIKSNDLDNLQYQIGNDSTRRNDVLFVKIPLPVNFTVEVEKEQEKDRIQIKTDTTKSVRAQKSLPKLVPVHRTGFVERTNVTRKNVAASTKQ